MLTHCTVDLHLLVPYRQAAPETAAAWLQKTGAACRGLCPGDAYVCRLLAEWKLGRAHALDLKTGGPQILRQLETVYDGGAQPTFSSVAQTCAAESALALRKTASCVRWKCASKVRHVKALRA